MKLKQIAQALGIECDNDVEITALNTLKDSNEHELSFLENKKYVHDLSTTKAAAVFVKENFSNQVPKGTIALICEEPYIALAKASKFFAPNLVEKEGIEPVIGENTTILPNVYLGKNTKIGKSCTIMAGAFIGDDVQIGDNTVIYPNVSIYRDCKIGSDCIIHSGTVIGSDGFGFANDNGKYVKIYQNGNVIIGNDVEIGSNTSIDRAAFKSTIIEDGVRIDNLVHIAHNCKLGKGSILTGQVGLSGSTTLNQYVIMGGQSATAGHLEIAPFTTIAARGGVTKSIITPKKFWAGFPLMEHRTWLKLQGKIAMLLKK
ncbi:UDP-3-O-(3-hydroxymyristoyl)glucosamine N-acyltransferase [Malaciobacter molluscorum LMG 25693]|uniref:UDP-3-O-acylglucosamine N-acyltransferase n=1 Tax=Malaciobacter molluscorum LMG 25693 TaxID=870501 RepID=A0A2G1DGT9_9BACT|nr:UDP-3-O-(3-hydroxymyristoyl)glucosamine N-acyltransferase [Malaciobacter molluscorum]AXX92465.1 UDP-3-O-(R-3-hydroxymyristoyl)-glucosamine N-acyltransferase [Malaciobacter molluscorum LMG 25693]PHO17664.1 UDP-3-O-(3-hydroxymyristoyl)glucosamine N-acyltransferase [Malaciobacter molluscorum LMG 25693]